MPEARARSRGFTLVEVLLALAVIAIGLGALIQAGSATIGNTGVLRDKTFAEWVALNKAAELHATAIWPGTGRSNGRVELAGRTWEWSMEVSDTPDPRVRRIEIAVHAEGGSRAGAAPLARLVSYAARRK